MTRQRVWWACPASARRRCRVLLHVRPCHPGPAVVARSAGSAWRSEELSSAASEGVRTRSTARAVWICKLGFASGGCTHGRKEGRNMTSETRTRRHQIAGEKTVATICGRCKGGKGCTRAVRRHNHTAHPVSAQRVPERAGKGVPGSRHEPVHCTVDGVGSVRLILNLTIGGFCVAVGLG